MKRKIYIETSVVSYLVSRPSKDVVVAGHQAATRDFWESIRNYDVFISDIVVQEAADGNETQAKMRLEALSGIPVIEIDDHVKTLAKKLIQGRAVPEKFIEDAFHIAVAAKHGMDVIVTWNFSHINNPFTRMMVRQIIENNGFACPEICSPDEFMGDET
ncbi:MAG: type II toxin-antitoxin system VapC family toxin [Victivallales bacterium]